MNPSVRVRFAPSPTGMLHIGGLRTALFNYLFAKHHGGTFILRIEDTDQNRYVEGAEADIIASLEWAGLQVDEGPHVGGAYGPYRQSERSALYRTYAEQLVEAGHAYYAFDTTEEIEAMRERLIKSGNPSPKYDAITRQSMKNSLTLPQDEVKRRLEAGEEHVIRLKVPRRETIKFDDLIRGTVSFDSAGLDDQVLMKSDGLPTYHLANVVDDHTMAVSHVIRGEEWLSSAPKHILLYQYFGWTPPTMAHLPLIMSPAGGKLSKRNAEELGIPVNVRDYREGGKPGYAGFNPEALVNFLAFLGWNPGTDEEIMSMEQLIGAFSIDKVTKAGAVFNIKKLHWYREQYFKRMIASKDPVDLKEDFRIAMEKRNDPALISGFLALETKDSSTNTAVILSTIQRSASLEESVDMAAPIYTGYVVDAVRPSITEERKATLTTLFEHIRQLGELRDSNDLNIEGLKKGEVFKAFRFALTGQEFGIEIDLLIKTFERDVILNKIGALLH